MIRASRETHNTGQHELQRQKDYVEHLANSNNTNDLIEKSQLVQSLRDLGYKNTITALGEITDNEIQARASNINLFLKETDKGCITDIAVIGNGYGMIPEMIKASARFGGTNRADSVEGFGRFGMGLPCSAISIGTRYTIYSATSSTKLHSVSVDLSEVAEQGPTYKMPIPKESSLPNWIAEKLNNSPNWEQDGLSRGTAIVIEKVDRLSWSHINNLVDNLVYQLGILYRDYLTDTKMFVEDIQIDPIDQMFSTPGMAGYEELNDPDKAEILPSITETYRGDDGKSGEVTIRYSRLPVGFAVRDKSRKPRAGSSYTHELRHRVMRDSNGIQVRRLGRLIDTIKTIPREVEWTGPRTFQNNDRFFGVEVNFPPTLDAEFSVTTSKQQITLSEKMWEFLNGLGVGSAIRELRKEVGKSLKERDLKYPDLDESNNDLPSEKAAEEAEEVRPPLSPEIRERIYQEGEEELQQEADKLSKESGWPKIKHENLLREHSQEPPLKVLLENNSEGPFYRARQFGGQRQLLINRDHPFFGDVYAHPDTTPWLRETLNCLLLSMASAEIESVSDVARVTFYRQERARWSEHLTLMLDLLPGFMNKGISVDLDDAA